MVLSLDLSSFLRVSLSSALSSAWTVKPSESLSTGRHFGRTWTRSTHLYYRSRELEHRS